MEALVSLHPKKVTSTLLKIVGLLLLAGSFCLYLFFGLGLTNGLGFLPLFDLNGEYNIPAFYSATAIWFCAFLLSYTYKQEKKLGHKNANYWRHFSYLFIFLGVDELASIHEIFGRFAPMIWERFPWLQISRKWIIPFSPVLLAIAVYFFRFYLQLSQQNKRRFTVAGLVFLSGAVGIEIIGEWLAVKYNLPPIYRGISAVLEEGAEMIGIVLFIRSLLLHIQSYDDKSNIVITLSFDERQEVRATNEQGMEFSVKTINQERPEVL